MTAFIVSPMSIMKIATIMSRIVKGEDKTIVSPAVMEAFKDTDGEVGTIASHLYKVNVESVNYLYCDNEPTNFTKDYINPRVPKKFFTDKNRKNVFQFVMNLRCWLYQSCKSQECRDSLVFKAVVELTEKVANYLGYTNETIGSTKEYQESVWK